MYYRFFSKIYEWAAKRMCFQCADFIEKGSKILDLGCGSAIIGKTFQDFFQAEIIGADIKDQRIFPIPFKPFDGKKLPFQENFFNVVLINYVLHHSQDPTALLNEAKRVAKTTVVFEDLPEGFLSKLRCAFHQFSYNIFFQKEKQKFNFKTEKEWEKIFQELGLNIIFKKRVNNFPVKKELFILGT